MTTILPRSTYTRHPDGFSRIARFRRAVALVTLMVAHYGAFGNVNWSNPTLAQTVQRLQNVRVWHVVNNGWADIGYDYAIDQAGRIIRLRSDDYAGAGAFGYNSTAVHVLFLIGDNEPLTNEARAAFRSLGRALKGKFRNLSTRPRGHGSLPGNATACPGRHVNADIAAGRLSFGGVAPVSSAPSSTSSGFEARPATTLSGFVIATKDTELRTEGNSRSSLVRKVRKGEALLTSGQQNAWWTSVGDYWAPTSALRSISGADSSKLHHGQYPDRALPENGSDSNEAKLAREELLMRMGAMSASDAGSGWSSLHKWLGEAPRNYSGNTTQRIQKYLRDLNLYDGGVSAQSSYGPQTRTAEKKWLNRNRLVFTPRPPDARPVLRAYAG